MKARIKKQNLFVRRIGSGGLERGREICGGGVFDMAEKGSAFMGSEHRGRKGFGFVFGVEVGEKVGDDLDLLREGRG